MEFSVRMYFDEKSSTYIYEVYYEKADSDGDRYYDLHILDFNTVKSLYPYEVLTPVDALTALNEHGLEDFA